MLWANIEPKGEGPPKHVDEERILSMPLLGLQGRQIQEHNLSNDGKPIEVMNNEKAREHMVEQLAIKISHKLQIPRGPNV
eukprot:c30692_g1_i1 orf=25-264(+)